MEFPKLLEMALLSLLPSLCCLAFYIYYALWMQPEKIRKLLARQGIRGPNPSFYFGNVLDMKRINSTLCVAAEGSPISHEFKLYPCFDLWRKQYGPVFSYSTGNRVTVYVSELDLVKEIALSTSLDLGKPSYMTKSRGALHGKESIITVNGQKWVHHRKIIAPEFFIEKVKGMVGLMVEATLPLLQSWESRVKLEGGMADMKVDDDLKRLSADVISRACFGSNFLKGKEIFTKIWDLQAALSAQSKLSAIPGFRYIPNKSNIKIWKVEKEIRVSVLKFVYDKKNRGSVEGDLLQAILENNDNAGSSSSNQFIVDNCKGIYFAGHETTASAVKWALLLLALHPEWQARVRADVLEICRGRTLDFDMLRQMKTLTMVIQEMLRLYPASPFIIRETLRDMKLGNFCFPKGINICIPMAKLQQDPEIWGQDAKDFNPERFANGVSASCKSPQMYMAFGFGARFCVGHHLATTELKVILSLMLTKFYFAISTNYRHSVVHGLLLESEFGVNLLVQRV